jgi:hypothetical protein
MKLVHLGAVSTGIVVLIGVILIVPAFLRDGTGTNGIILLLSFDVQGDSDVSSWCQGLASVLHKHQIKAAVFVSGEIAQTKPECVASFSSDVDVGSQTYSYVDLTAIDYIEALEEVRAGKRAVDEAGQIDSRLFKAPYGSTDENIYSLLQRSRVLADFSYPSQYNKFENDLFVKYNLTSFSGDTDGQSQFFAFISSSSPVTTPIAVNFDSSMQLEQIDEFISKLESVYYRIHFVNASDLTGLNLTVLEDESA